MNNLTKKFTLEQILTAHSKVKSGADFPNYIKEIKQHGVFAYEHYVTDGHINYQGEDDFSLSSAPKWTKREVALEINAEKLINDLKVHQAGNSDYHTFCKQAIEAGVEKWKVDLIAMTCTYYSANDRQMLLEIIPAN
jgi:uncharacterized protein YbcV (DUF1398 family)